MKPSGDIRFLTSRVIIAALISVLFFTLPVQAAPHIGAAAYCLMDLDTGQVLAGQNLYQPRPVASTTKVMTAILVLEYADKYETVTISEKAARTPESAIGLEAGQELRVIDLLKAALICSANDASVALAEYIAGSEDLFAWIMNKKALILGACNTNFRNASGLPDEKHVSTCYDLAVITRYALRDQTFGEMVATRDTRMNHPGYPAGLIIKNTNRLLSIYDGAFGVKTGTTNAAGQCLIGAARRENRRLLSVVLRSWDRYADSTRLLNYGFESFIPTKVVDKTNPLKQLRVQNGKQLEVKIYPEKDVCLWLPESMNGLEKAVQVNYRPSAPLARGEKVGEMEVRYLGTTVARVNLVAGEDVEREPEGILRLFYRFYLQVEKELRER